MKNLIVCPGISYTTDMFDPIISALTSEYNCIPFIPRRNNLQQNMLELANLCSGNFSILGHSSSGSMALACAATYSERVEKVITSGANAHSFAEVDDFLREGIKQINSGDAQEFKDAMRHSAIGKQCNNYSHVDKYIIAMQKQIDEVTLLSQVESYLKSLDITNELASINADCLIIHNEFDGFYNIDEAEYITHNIKHATMKIAAGVGHMGIVEDPNQYIKLVKSFL